MSIGSRGCKKKRREKEFNVRESWRFVLAVHALLSVIVISYQLSVSVQYQLSVYLQLDGLGHGRASVVILIGGFTILKVR